MPCGAGSAECSGGAAELVTSKPFGALAVCLVYKRPSSQHPVKEVVVSALLQMGKLRHVPVPSLAQDRTASKWCSWVHMQVSDFS